MKIVHNLCEKNHNKHATMTIKNVNIAFQIHNITDGGVYMLETNKNHATAWQGFKMEDGTNTVCKRVYPIKLHSL